MRFVDSFVDDLYIAQEFVDHFLPHDFHILFYRLAQPIAQPVDCMLRHADANLLGQICASSQLGNTLTGDSALG